MKFSCRTGQGPRTSAKGEHEVLRHVVLARRSGVSPTLIRQATFTAVSIAIVAATAGCGSVRGVVDDAALSEQLAFLSRPEISRPEVEARLGTASETYEQGTVVSYALYLEGENRLTTVAGSTRKADYTLMLHYGPDGRLLRHSLLRKAQ